MAANGFDASIFGVNDRLGSIAGNYDTIIFCLSSDYSLSVLKKLHHLRDRLIVVSAMSPVLLGDVPWVESAIAVYSYSPWSFTAAFGAIAGDFVPTGTLPLKDIHDKRFSAAFLRSLSTMQSVSCLT